MKSCKSFYTQNSYFADFIFDICRFEKLDFVTLFIENFSEKENKRLRKEFTKIDTSKKDLIKDYEDRIDEYNSQITEREEKIGELSTDNKKLNEELKQKDE